MTKNEAIKLLESGKELTVDEREEIVRAIRDNVPSYDSEWESSEKCW
jgi:hypothetical protein